ncbi:hypothetical protein Franean1_4131 [Parafrankia sp. EAN1pec]|nr:hypothetical protein Franean1_4131 [Frankia sp. EAN1pec]
MPQARKSLLQQRAHRLRVEQPAQLQPRQEPRWHPTILDATRGPGFYAEELTRRGARIIGFDQSPVMVALTRKLVPTAR